MDLPSITIQQLQNSGLEYGFCYQDNLLITDQVEAIERFRQPCRIYAITFLVCISGEAECIINLNHYHIEKNMIVVAFPDEIIQVKATQHLEAYAVLISSALSKDLGMDYSRRSDFYLRIRKNASCQLTHEQIAPLKPYYTFYMITFCTQRKRHLRLSRDCCVPSAALSSAKCTWASRKKKAARWKQRNPTETSSSSMTSWLW